MRSTVETQHSCICFKSKFEFNNNGAHNQNSWIFYTLCLCRWNEIFSSVSSHIHHSTIHTNITSCVKLQCLVCAFVFVSISNSLGSVCGEIRTYVNKENTQKHQFELAYRCPDRCYLPKFWNTKIYFLFFAFNLNVLCDRNEKKKQFFKLLKIYFAMYSFERENI